MNTDKNTQRARSDISFLTDPRLCPAVIAMSLRRDRLLSKRRRPLSRFSRAPGFLTDIARYVTTTFESAHKCSTPGKRVKCDNGLFSSVAPRSRFGVYKRALCINLE